MKYTGNNTDVAIEGKGFFEVQLPNGTTALTRDGEFQINSHGQLVTKESFPVLGASGPIQMNRDNSGPISISAHRRRQPGLRAAREAQSDGREQAETAHANQRQLFYRQEPQSAYAAEHGERARGLSGRVQHLRRGRDGQLDDGHAGFRGQPACHSNPGRPTEPHHQRSRQTHHNLCCAHYIQRRPGWSPSS